MGGDDGEHLMMFFPAPRHLMPPGAYPPPPPPLPPPPPFPEPGAYTYARPGYAYAQTTNAYPPPLPPGPYAYPPQGYPYPGSPAAPHVQGETGHGSSGHGGERQMESKPKAGGGAAATASVTAGYGGINHGSSGSHGDRRQVEVKESTQPKAAAGGKAAGTDSALVYRALDKLSRGHSGGSRPGKSIINCLPSSTNFGFFGKCCGGHRTTSFKRDADGHGY